MATGNNQAGLAAQLEAMHSQLELLLLEESVLWSQVEKADDVTVVGTRPMRVPYQTATGGLFGVFNPDGADMGTGSGPQEVPAYISSAWYLQASQYTALAEYATDSDKKAIKNYVTLTHEQAFTTFPGYMDVQATQNGSNTIDTIVAVGSGYLQVNQANAFQTNQLFDVWSAIGGTKIATGLQVLNGDPATNYVWTTSAIPVGVTAGMVCTVYGSTGQANSGFFGLQYFNTNLNVGNFLGVQRSSYPGLFTAQGVNLNGGQLTPGAVRAMQVSGMFAMGERYVAGRAVAHCAPDQQAAWENNFLPVQTYNVAQEKRSTSSDMLPGNMPGSIGGRPFLVNRRAPLGRIDFIDLNNLAKVETKAADYYSVNGQTVFPVIGESGGIQSQNLFYIVYGGNMFMRNPRLSTYITNAAIPRFVAGH